MDEDKSLPAYAYLSPEDVAGYATLTEQGTYDLLDAEVFWRDRYWMFHKHGYLLRPRYHPSWSPSWKGTNRDPTYCEDSVVINRPHVLDAKRLKDNTLVCLKTVEKGSLEIEISQFLTRVQHSHNHCVPVLDVIPDDIADSNLSFVVTPYLRPMNNPPFSAIEEVVDFVEQTLEGLVFLHSQGVAHRDIAPQNIMMDAQTLYPHGHHPIRLKYSIDNVREVTPLARLDHPVRYFFIDFGISHRFTDRSSTMLVGLRGRNQSVPELSATIPYDAFKVDVYALGDLYYKEFTQRFHGLAFLDPLVNAMRERDPGTRVSAEGALVKFRDIRSTVANSSLRWRLSPRAESTPERVVYGVVDVTRQGIYHLKRFMG
ncbi:kinase-like domain-containing protein [Earliella scabrosa]|nr:kinase-like domain-containing protein [Earliella scabrosa]